MSRAKTVILDSEAVQATIDWTHPKHRTALAAIEVVTQRQRRQVDTTLVVPTSIRVEAGWDRRAPDASRLNRLRAADLPLDTDTANDAALIRAALCVSVPDAHLGAAARGAAQPVGIITSDRQDADRILDYLGLNGTITVI